MGSTSQTAKGGGGRLAALTGWIDDRFPMTKMWKEQVSEYYAPKNMNFWYFFGSLAMLVMVIQILTGVVLPPDFTTFWNQALQQGFKPKAASIGKAILFPVAVEALHLPDRSARLLDVRRAHRGRRLGNESGGCAERGQA